MSEKATRLLICSDIHYASEQEKARGGYELNAISNPLQRLVVRTFRNFVWLRDPFEHNHLIEQVLNPGVEPDIVVANGDFSCDSAFIGVSDPASQESAREVLEKLRRRFGEKFHATFGDHELGKRTLAGGRGGMRLASWHAAQEQLGLKPFWIRRIQPYVLIGITSSLVALPVYAKETLPEELPGWEELRKEHLSQIQQTFAGVQPGEKVILFCHDPTALPFLHDDEIVAKHLHCIERTIIGHLHTPIVLWESRLLAGMPQITFMGNAVRRMSRALNQARKWKPFKVLLCPSLAGVQIRKRGGYYTTDLMPNAREELDFRFHHIKWEGNAV